MVIRYRYAYNSVNKIVDVNELQKQPETYKKTFKCLGCDHSLTPVLGQKRQKHFRHKVDIDCSPETYLHKLAKAKFYEVYNDCLLQNKPFTIAISQERKCNYFELSFLYRCELKNMAHKYDLTKYFREIYLEQKEDLFIPDLLLISERGEKIFVEIAVSHQASQEKVNSGYRIIEIYVEEENDLKVINSKNIAQGEKVKLYNFKTNIVKNFCQGECFQQLKPYAYCVINYDYFVIFSSGKSAILNIPLNEIKSLHNLNKIKYGEFIYNSNPNMILSNEYIKLVIESFVNNRQIKNCFLCRYHGKSYESSDPIYCKFLKKSCNSNEAASCEYYRPDTKVFPSLDFYN